MRPSGPNLVLCLRPATLALSLMLWFLGVVRLGHALDG
jgi:hypothetical protein